MEIERQEEAMANPQMMKRNRQVDEGTSFVRGGEGLSLLHDDPAWMSRLQSGRSPKKRAFIILLSLMGYYTECRHLRQNDTAETLVVPWNARCRKERRRWGHQKMNIDKMYHLLLVFFFRPLS